MSMVNLHILTVLLRGRIERLDGRVYPSRKDVTVSIRPLRKSHRVRFAGVNKKRAHCKKHELNNETYEKIHADLQQ